jgi:hypothetical protein
MKSPSSTSPPVPTSARPWCTWWSRWPAGIHSAHRRRRHPQARISAACSTPVPTRSRSTPRRSTRNSSKRPPSVSARSASWWPSTPRSVSGDGEPNRWEIFTHGGRKATGLDAVEWAKKHGGVRRRRDPAYQHGPRRHQKWLRPGTDPRGGDAVHVPVIASGGVGNLDHLVEGVREGHADAVLAASIFHFGDLHHRAGQAAHGRRRCGSAPVGVGCDHSQSGLSGSETRTRGGRMP